MSEKLHALEPWQWPEETWRRHVNAVRAGKSLAPDEWPGGAKCAVALSFDADHETIPLRDNETRPGRLSQGEYGSRRGSYRIIELLAKHDIVATFFVPGVSALLHSGEIQGYVSAGHEVGIHGWIHERNMLLEESDERQLMFRAADTLERVTGVRPVGIRTPSWDFSDYTLQISLDLELEYDSSLMADNEPYEILKNNEPTGLVEIPVEWIRDDAPYFNNERYTAVRPHSMPRLVAEMWRDEFDVAYAEGGLFQLTMHPHIIGHRSRIAALSQLVEHIASYNVWFATHAQIARYCRMAKL